MSDQTPSNCDPQIPNALVNIATGFAQSQTLFTACDLGIFDLLHESKASQSAAQIVKKLESQVHPNSLTRLLDALSALEILGRDTSTEPAPLYSNTPMVEQFLVKTSPLSVLGCITGYRMTMYPMFANLGHGIKDGTWQWQRTFNKSPDEIWEHLYNRKEELIQVQEWMDALMRVEGPRLVSAFDLSSFKHMCDIGGGTGRLAYEASRLYPDMRMTVLDLPQVVEVSEHFRPPADKYPDQQHVRFTAGDFFTDELPKADLYAMVRIMHDWGEEKLDHLLAKIFKALPSGGGLLIGEILLNEDKTRPVLGSLMSLQMLLFCETGARERSESEYKELLKKHGFVNVKTKVTGASYTDAILAMKP